MQKTINNYSKLALIIFTLYTMFSCSKDENINNLDETLFVRHKNADMPAYIHGNGSEKVFLISLHGGPGGWGLNLRSPIFKNKVEKECAVVYFDQRGSGMAQGHYSKSEINIDVMAEDVLALVKVIKHKYGNDSRFFLIGFSWGGALGSATLLKDQSDFLGWIDVDGSHNIKGLYKGYISNFKRVAAEQIEAGNNITYWNEIIEFVNKISPEYKHVDDMYDLNREAFNAEEVLEESNLINKEKDLNDKIAFKYNILPTLWNTFNTQSILDRNLFKNVTFTDRLHEITIPSLVLWGRHDMVVPISFAQEAYDNLGAIDKKLVIFEKSGHSPMFREPDLFAEEVIQFIKKNK